MNVLNIIVRYFSWQQPWIVLGTSTLALGTIGVIAFGVIDERQPSPTSTETSMDSALSQKLREESNASEYAPSDSGDVMAMKSNGPLPKSSDTETTASTHSGESPREVPHPLSTEHERLFAINRVLQAAKQAVDQHDVPQLRELLAQHGVLEPKDPMRQRSGYERIADCLESPGPASRQAALHFWQTETASPVRRLLRRKCLEK